MDTTGFVIRQTVFEPRATAAAAAAAVPQLCLESNWFWNLVILCRAQFAHFNLRGIPVGLL